VRYIRIYKGKIVSDEWIERRWKDGDGMLEIKQMRIDDGF